MTRPLVLAAGFAAFALLATLNSAGYRYGAADQAFYIPAILRHLDPALFPRDAALIDSQSRLFVLDEIVAWLTSSTGVGLPWWFLTGYLASLGALYAALILLGRSIASSNWTIAAFVALSTLKHRIAKTGANTLEGHFHPRQLAFAIGLLAVAAVLRRRPALALAAVALSGLIHPTTALWFGAWVGVALVVSEPRWRPTLLVAGALAVAAAAGVLMAGFLPTTRMDAAWIATLADKDYIFPDEWSAGTWAINLAYPLVIGLTYLYRRRLGLTTAAEAGVVAGCLALVLAFAASLPFIAAKIAAFVQLQCSRVFWMADTLAMLYVAWWLCEAWRASHGASRAAAGDSPRAPAGPVAIALVLAVVAAVRGSYVLLVEHPGRPLVQATLPADDWGDVSDWIKRSMPAGAHVLADPGHAWKYGFSVRVSAARDVLLEDVKDGSIAMYDRAVALRVAERRAAIGDFAALTPSGVQALASRYDLDCLISERTLPLPELYRNTRFRVYRLQP
jgi:hypothetical protein